MQLNDITVPGVLCMELVVGTPLGVSKFDFSDNFVSKNSAQIAGTAKG